MKQWNYALQVICYFGLERCQSVLTTMVERFKFILDMNKDTIDPTYYQSIVDKFI